MPSRFLLKTELNILSSIFRGLEKDVKDKESQDTINLLVSVFGGSSFEKEIRKRNG